MVVQTALDERSILLRSLIIDALEGGRRGHVGSSLSLVEIVRVLYDDILDVRPSEPRWRDRDRFILSKGHGCLALFAVLADHGFFGREALVSQCRAGALLGGHPETNVPGVEAATGALGHGLAIGVGLALAARMQRRTSRVYVVMGDGELGEGSVWEAALAAAKHRLGNLTAVVDYNKLQCYGRIDAVLPLEPLADKWRAFGFGVSEVDGHDVSALRATFSVPADRCVPRLIIAHTVKGKGVGFAENDPAWHHKAKLGEAQLAQMRDALLAVR
ncbi:MAG: transketolase [Candidatus Velthaea sp.]